MIQDQAPISVSLSFVVIFHSFSLIVRLATHDVSKYSSRKKSIPKRETKSRRLVNIRMNVRRIRHNDKTIGVAELEVLVRRSRVRHGIPSIAAKPAAI